MLAAPVGAQATLEPEGAAELALALRRLGPTQRVLMVGAHPDDENTAVLAELALGAGADVAYLALTRGEGGQNLIGPELQEGLGLIRSEELLAARRLDGARQFFTRAYDFGYSKSADETFRQWPKDTLLADVVATVRRFRPDVIIAVFSGTPRDGHGQHQASGILAREAFEAAADPTRFPEQARWGLRPHRAAYVFQSLFFGRQDGGIPLETGAFDPVLGRSHFQVAMASRSRHRSQDMGMPQPAGPQTSALIPVAGAIPPGATSIFDGLDQTLEDRARSLRASATVVQAIAEYRNQVAAATAAFNPLRPAGLVAPLARAILALDRAAGADNGGELAFHLGIEREQAADVLRRAAGIVIDATVDKQRVIPGGDLTLTVRLWNGGESPLTVNVLRPLLAGDPVASTDAAAPFTLEAGALEERTFRIRVPADAPVTEPYFLRAERDGALYRWPAAPELRGLPFEPPPVRIRADVNVSDVRLSLESEATFPQVDKSLGELRLPIFIVPAVAVTATPHIAAIPLGAVSEDGRSREIVVTVEAQDPAADGTASLDLPPGWRSDPASIDITFETTGERRTARFRVLPPATLTPGTVQIGARFRVATGATYERGYAVIAYPHTRGRTLYTPAQTRVAVLPVAIADGLRVGVVEGAGDDAALVLSQLGATVEPLDADALARGDLSRFHAIVTGTRAYEVRADLIANNARLLDWVRAGGTLVVQYNKYELVEGGFAPYPLTMSRPHGRVADETSPVRIVEPDHPALNRPNRITTADFDGWVHERGLYFADTWDDRYAAPLEMADPGEPALRGSLLIASVGRGHYVYTGLALFRQWPDAVPGAFRLIANLVSLGRTGETTREPPRR